MSATSGGPAQRASGSPPRSVHKVPPRLSAQMVELIDAFDGSVTTYPSLYKSAKFLGTYNHNVTKHNGLSYTTCDGKTYKINILPAASIHETCK